MGHQLILYNIECLIKKEPLHILNIYRYGGVLLHMKKSVRKIKRLNEDFGPLLFKFNNEKSLTVELECSELCTLSWLIMEAGMLIV